MEEEDNTKTATGLIACGICALFFGSMYVPFKKFNAGDGFFAQWVMCCSILLAGFLIYVYEGFPQFYPLAMLGGAFWTIGNAMSIPVIGKIGMAMGILIWNTALCITGWAAGRFGLFGMKPRPPKNDLLNYIGLVLVLIGGALFSQIRSEPNAHPKRPINMTPPPAVKLISENGEDVALQQDEPMRMIDDDVEGMTIGQNTVTSKQRLVAILMALGVGVLFGVNFVPVIHIQDNPDKFPGAPIRGMPYVFSHYFGIFITGTVIFIGYSILKGNRPSINPQMALPAFFSGLLWSVAQTSFFVANEKLSQTVTFPIIGTLPSCVAVVWSIFVFREIQGVRNYKILAVAFVLVISGVVLVGISKDLEW